MRQHSMTPQDALPKLPAAAAARKSNLDNQRFEHMYQRLSGRNKGGTQEPLWELAASRCPRKCREADQPPSAEGFLIGRVHVTLQQADSQAAEAAPQGVSQQATATDSSAPAPSMKDTQSGGRPASTRKPRPSASHAPRFAELRSEAIKPRRTSSQAPKSWLPAVRACSRGRMSTKVSGAAHVTAVSLARQPRKGSSKGVETGVRAAPTVDNTATAGCTGRPAKRQKYAHVSGQFPPAALQEDRVHAAPHSGADTVTAQVPLQQPSALATVSPFPRQGAASEATAASVRLAPAAAALQVARPVPIAIGSQILLPPPSRTAAARELAALQPSAIPSAMVTRCPAQHSLKSPFSAAAQIPPLAALSSTSAPAATTGVLPPRRPHTTTAVPAEVHTSGAPPAPPQAAEAGGAAKMAAKKPCDRPRQHPARVQAADIPAADGSLDAAVRAAQDWAASLCAAAPGSGVVRGRRPRRSALQELHTPVLSDTAADDLAQAQLDCTGDDATRTCISLQIPLFAHAIWTSCR